MDEISRRQAEQAQESTRWLLVVLGIAAVLAGAVIVVADIADLVGNRWQQVGVVSAGITVLALVVGLLAVLRSLDPFADATSTTDDARRRVVQRYRTTRLVVTVVVVVALAGMAGMAIASVEDGNKVEARTRRAAAAPATLPEDAPIAEPVTVAVQLTTPGLAKVATAMRCTGVDLGPAPLQGWAVAGDFREPTVVILTPSPACRNARVDITAADGFAYPSILVPTTTAPTTTPPAATPPAATPPTTATPLG